MEECVEQSVATDIKVVEIVVGGGAKQDGSGPLTIATPIVVALLLIVVTE